MERIIISPLIYVKLLYQQKLSFKRAILLPLLLKKGLTNIKGVVYFMTFGHYMTIG